MASQWLVGVAITTLVVGVAGLDNGLALTPPRGWRSWNCDHGDVNDTTIRRVVDAVTAKSRMVDGTPTSLLDVGFSHVGVDDGWQLCNAGRSVKGKPSFHAADGTPLVNQSRFPSLKDLVDYGHSKGVLMGWYDNNCICMDEYTLRSDPVWAETCYAADAKQIVDAGFDSIKIDNCGDDDGSGFVSRMKHINASGHAILVENSNQGHGAGPPRGLPNNTVAPGWCNFNIFRSGGDIGPDFMGTVGRLQRTIPFQDLKDPISRPGCWAYPDMLEVGNFQGPLNMTESRSHFSAWAVVSSPLVLGFDLTNSAMVDELWPIISNPEVHAVNQAWAGHPGRQVASTDTYQVWAKKLSATSQAVLVFSTSANPVDVSVPLSNVGLSGTASARDLWARQPAGQIDSTWSIKQLTSHDCRFFTLTSA
eukprot:m.173365 g.173365  ORF g.173365 m.173365 type:complete len:420 (-) comp14846_c0_seq1:71-1330(-)